LPADSYNELSRVIAEQAATDTATFAAQLAAAVGDTDDGDLAAAAARDYAGNIEADADLNGVAELSHRTTVTARAGLAGRPRLRAVGDFGAAAGFDASAGGTPATAATADGKASLREGRNRRYAQSSSRLGLETGNLPQ
jgi:hypothetical protein